MSGAETTGRLPQAFFAERSGMEFAARAGDGTSAGRWTLTEVSQLPSLPVPRMEGVGCYHLTFSTDGVLPQAIYRLECVTDGASAVLFAVPGFGQVMHVTVN